MTHGAQPIAARDPSHCRPMPIGIDDGYACTKLALPDGRLLTVPSTARPGRSRVTWMPNARPIIFEYETGGRIYSVGEVNAVPTRFDGYPISGLNRAIVQHALQCADLEGQDVHAVSGLPVGAYYRHSGSRRQGAIAAKRENLLQPVQPKNLALATDIVEHEVIPEALAAWYDHVIAEQGGVGTLDKAKVQRPIAVVDIGGRTTDTVVVRNQGVVHGSSGSCPLGMLDAEQAFAERIEERFDIGTLDPRLTQRVFASQSLRLYGRDYDVSGDVAEARQELVERLHAEVRRQLGGGAELDSVVFVGGGALALGEAIGDWFPNQTTASRPEFANARGMLKYLRYVANAETAAEER